MYQKGILVVTIDTESDLPQWQTTRSYSFENIKAIPSLQQIFDNYSIKPTYLITHSVAIDKKSVDVLSKVSNDNKCEIGAHLHPNETPPFCLSRKEGKSFLKLDFLTKKRKIENLTAAISINFKKPVSYRAGSYRFDTDSLLILEELGYLVDTSVTPYISWRIEGGLSYINVPLEPYWPDKDDICKEGENRILEVPITIRLNRKMNFFLKNIYLPVLSMPMQSSKFRRLISNIRPIKPIWLRPTYSTYDEMKNLCDILFGNHNFQVLNMMFHSNELIISGSPFHKTKRDINRFLLRIDNICNYLITSKGIASKTLSEVYTIFAGS